MCRRRLSSWTRRAQFPPSNRIFHLSESRIPDRSRGDTATPLITFLSLFLLSSEGLVFSVPEVRWLSVCGGHGHVSIWGSFFCSFGIRVSLPSLLSSLWMPGVFRLLRRIRQWGGEGVCHRHHRCSMWSKKRCEFKNGNMCKRLWGRAGAFSNFI